MVNTFLLVPGDLNDRCHATTFDTDMFPTTKTTLNTDYLKLHCLEENFVQKCGSVRVHIPAKQMYLHMQQALFWNKNLFSTALKKAMIK